MGIGGDRSRLYTDVTPLGFTICTLSAFFYTDVAPLGLGSVFPRVLGAIGKPHLPAGKETRLGNLVSGAGAVY